MLRSACGRGQQSWRRLSALCSSSPLLHHRVDRPRLARCHSPPGSRHNHRPGSEQARFQRPPPTTCSVTGCSRASVEARARRRERATSGGSSELRARLYVSAWIGEKLLHPMGGLLGRQARRDRTNIRPISSVEVGKEGLPALSTKDDSHLEAGMAAPAFPYHRAQSVKGGCRSVPQNVYRRFVLGESLVWRDTPPVTRRQSSGAATKEEGWPRLHSASPSRRFGV